ncbi:hypothetical protein ATO7_06160 [Oceanococcus atlanticus]|uniref:Uncharacterized protein n=1 Tax=Oceanococcus atlanticus TaxID=1317117 RepID=A0A1Y1SJJ0_9GAMM|nr:hypothetical protein [Oceanococcus atlanticus]ORE89441.1 hypothetical protein ATO7_06160 [Oceanococcus atlanticus]
MDIEFLIISTNDYVVCLDTALDVDWKTSDEYDKRGHDDPQQFNRILNAVTLLETKPQHHLSSEMKQSFRRLLGEAVARALGGDYGNACTAVDQAKQFLTDRSREKSREWYLIASGTSAAIFALCGIAIWLLREKATPLLGQSALLFLICSVSGALGAFASIALRLGKMEVEAQSGRFLHQIEAFARVVSGAIGGFFGAVMVKLGLVLPLLDSGESMSLTMLLVGFVAGASERLIPTLISNVEESQVSLNE